MFWGILFGVVGAAAAVAVVVAVVLLLCSLRESPLLKKEEIKGGRNEGRWASKGDVFGWILGGRETETEKERERGCC